MPTSDEFKAMKDATNWKWEDNGYYVTKLGEALAGDKSNALLFFPAAGSGSNGGLYNAGLRGLFWSSTLRSENTETAYNLYFISDNVDPQVNGYHHNGFSVRPLSD